MTMGSYIRERRLQLNMTQEDLGDAAGTSKAYISQIEVGKVALPNADLRRRLADALQLRHVDLLIAGAGIRPFRAHQGMPRTVAQVFYGGKGKS